ncbi:MAG: hypothetical protein RIM72_16605 [Alphaproteobacteria bacterium]
MTNPIRTVFPSKGGDKPLLLKTVIADAGEAVVYSTDDPGILAKLYHQPTAAQSDKIAAMVANPPADPSIRPGHRSFTWPLDILLNAEGEFIGFLMPAVPAPHSATAWASPKLRRRAGLQASWSGLHAVAANLAFVVGHLNDAGIVLGDLKTDNVLVDGHGLVTLIDCDSFQIDGPGATPFLCRVTTEDFCAPELFGKDLGEEPRDETADRFSLAVAIFKLLIGASPFSGDWRGGGEPATPAANAIAGRWIWGNDGFLSPPAALPDAETIHPNLIRFFDRAFRAGAGTPEDRPSGAEWHETLCLVMAELGTCSEQPAHYLYDGSPCPWCRQALTIGGSTFDAAEGDPPADPRTPLVQAFERALARGDTRMAVDLWDDHAFLSEKVADCRDSIDRFRKGLAQFDNWRGKIKADDPPDAAAAKILLADWKTLSSDVSGWLHWEDVNGYGVPAILARLQEISKTKPADNKPKPASTGVRRRPVGPLLAGPPTIMIKEPAPPEKPSRDADRPQVTYRIEAGWLNLKPARLVIEAAGPVVLPELELIDRLTGQALVQCPAGRVTDTLTVPFAQPVTPTVVILTVAAGSKDTVEIVSPPVRNRTIGAPAGPPSPPPHVRKVFVNA